MASLSTAYILLYYLHFSSIVLSTLKIVSSIINILALLKKANEINLLV